MDWKEEAREIESEAIRAAASLLESYAIPKLIYFNIKAALLVARLTGELNDTMRAILDELAEEE